MKKLTLYTLRTGLFLCVPLSAASQTVYVAPDATGNGSSWVDARGDLQNVLNSAMPGTEIWVESGSYYPTSCDNCTFNDRNQYFQIPNGIILYGGFAGNETHPDQRDIEAHPTYLSGDIDGDSTLTNNSFTVVYTKDVSNLTQIDGFIISGGNADQDTAGLGTPPNSGGGWFNLGSTVTGNSSPVIANCTFIDNYAWGYGGGMFNDGSFSGICNPVLINCNFSNNISGFGGGGIYNTGSFNGQCSPVLTNCLFDYNECLQSDGGGIFSIGAEEGEANPEITTCTFRGNTAFHDGGALYNFGKGGICSPVVNNCLFENNEAHAGGAIYNDGTFNGFTGGVFTNCIFTENHANGSDGGAIYNSGYQGTSNPAFINCLFDHNNSAFAGGAIFNNGVEGTCNADISHCRFISNTADTYGGAMYNQGKTGHASPSVTNSLFYDNSALSAGAIYNLGAESGNANARLINCTFYGNHANVGGAVYCNAGEEGTGTSSPLLSNCIFWANTASDEGDIFRIIWGTPTIDFSLADKSDCDDLYNGNAGSLTCGAGMIFNEDPLFLGPASGNFHLTTNSPAIDVGDNAAANENGIATDLDSLPRIHNGTVDMGVFEFGSTAGGMPVIMQQPQSQEVCAGDEVSFSVVANGSQPLSYQWLLESLPIPGATLNEWAITSADESDEGAYACQIVSASGDTIVSNAAILTVNEPAEVSITISASQLEICEGKFITLIAQPVNGGLAPLYQWYLNGAGFGSSVSQLDTNNISDGDTFTCQLTSSETCVLNSTATSNSLSISVESLISPSLTIASNTAMPCEGQEVTVSADPVNGGNSPSFSWSVNGNAAGSDSPFFTFTALSGDTVQCTLTSSENCVIMNPVSSNLLILALTPNVTPVIQVSPSTDSIICQGSEVVFTTEVEHGGDTPGYEWMVNGLPAGVSTSSFATDLLNDQDEIFCVLTSSLECVEANPVGSNMVTVSVDSCMLSANGLNEQFPSVFLFPNPAKNKIFVKVSGLTGNFVLHLLNTQGQQLISERIEHPVAPFQQALDVTNFPKGVYYIQIITDNHLALKKLVIQ